MINIKELYDNDSLNLTVRLAHDKDRKHYLVGENAKYVNDLRRACSEYNRNRPAGAVALRVALQGRIGKNNPNAYKYKGRMGPMRILLEDAAYAGVYIWSR